MARSAGFPGGLEERTAYLGWPLLIVAGLALVLAWRSVAMRVCLTLAVLMEVLALGDELTIDGGTHGVRLPFSLITGWPGFEHVLPSRFALFSVGLLGAAVAFALHEIGHRRSGVRVAGTAAVVVALVAPVVPAFFTGAAATELACPGGSALVLPYPGPQTTDPMLWQEAAGMSFAMPGGYFIGPADDGHAYVGGQPSVSGTLFTDVQNDGRTRPVTPRMRQAFAADMARWHACAVVLGPARNLDAVRDQATALLGKEPEIVDGVYLWRG